ncbi:MAG: hypothetical protein K0U93_08430 [Gammaproteobacteria bacterium]|nr:hypothetical protein [Gammaproteobacteria bacterium]
MDNLTPELEPEWEVPLTLTLTAGAIIDSVFATAESVHTGAQSCIDPELVVVDITAPDENSDNYCRYVEQRYVEDSLPDVTWQDWTIELRLDATFIVGHWRAQVSSGPADWDWCAAQAESAFGAAAVLVGKRVRRGIVVEQSSYGPKPPHVKH